MILYKYLDEKGAVETIKRCSVLLNSPNKYNDPFDCKLYSTNKEIESSFKLFVNYQIYKKLYDELIVKNTKSVKNKLLSHVTKINLQSIKKTVKRTKKYNLQPDLDICWASALRFLGKNKRDLKREFKNAINAYYKRIKDLMLVSCFGTKNDSILMWSHYANKHKGACIEFDVDDSNFHLINYSKRIPDFKLTNMLKVYFGHELIGESIDTSDSRYKYLSDPLLTKSDEWVYEGEVRCVYSNKKRNPAIYETKDESGDNLILLRMIKINAIFLGCNAEQPFIEDVKKIRGSIPLKIMKMSDDEYKISPVDFF